MKRREAREILFTLLYEASFCDCDNKDKVYDNALQSRELSDDEYIRSSFHSILRHSDELDEIISKFSHGWNLGRISRVTMSILRLSVYEMLYATDVPCVVSINEAVELAKKYDHEKAPKFVNGILNNAADYLKVKNEPSDSAYASADSASEDE